MFWHSAYSWKIINVGERIIDPFVIFRLKMLSPIQTSIIEYRYRGKVVEWLSSGSLKKIIPKFTKTLIWTIIKKFEISMKNFG